MQGSDEMAVSVKRPRQSASIRDGKEFIDQELQKLWGNVEDLAEVLEIVMVDSPTDTDAEAAPTKGNSVLGRELMSYGDRIAVLNARLSTLRALIDL